MFLIICTRIFNWFKRNSSWYDDEDVEPLDEATPAKDTETSKKNHK